MRKIIILAIFLFVFVSSANADYSKLSNFFGWVKIHETYYNGYVGNEIRENPDKDASIKYVILMFMEPEIRKSKKGVKQISDLKRVYTQIIYEENGDMNVFYLDGKSFVEAIRMDRIKPGDQIEIKKKRVFSQDEPDNGP